VAFNIQNRRYFTSDQKRPGETISGIEKMETFMFEELIPLLQESYKGGTFLTLIGHSRTAFLVNYLTFKRPNSVNIAIAASGFFDTPATLDNFHKLLNTEGNFNHNFFYFGSAGTTLEEVNYKVEYDALDSLIMTKGKAKNVFVSLSETKHANHMTNYWTTVPLSLMQVFSSYNDLLNNWFHDKLNQSDLDLGVQSFEEDLAAINRYFGAQFSPNLTHIYSLASHFANQNGDYAKGIEFFEMGLKYYPDFLEFYVEIIEFCKLAENETKEQHYKTLLREKAQQSSRLSQEEKQEIMDYLNAE
jgi:tetratricopeptide (TPR) repeat protein